ncbi:MAG TPA: flagellar hook-basal body complex protein FliE [Steroidobacteraceae bacterium]|nr:flagellar hook-basal body complex protein FliE [Steroidobacteraceae bacterium]
MSIDSVLAQIRSLQAQTKIGVPAAAKPTAPAPGAGPAGGAGRASFANVLQQGLDAVNASQNQAADLAARFERGEPGLELSQVMLESQKATVALRATVEVRNRLVSAYQDIMNMPI